MAIPLSKFVGVESTASGAGPGAYQRALFTANDAANARTDYRGSGHR